MIDTKSDPGSYADHLSSTGRFRAVADPRDAELERLQATLAGQEIITDRYAAEIAALRAEIAVAPHSMGCSSLQGGPTSEDWGALSRCDCWKVKALRGEGT